MTTHLSTPEKAEPEEPCQKQILLPEHWSPLSGKYDAINPDGDYIKLQQEVLSLSIPKEIMTEENKWMLSTPKGTTSISNIKLQHKPH